MTASPRAASTGRRLRAAAAVLLCVSAAQAQVPPPPEAKSGIYTCTDDKGNKLTADRPIPVCSHKEQRVLNRDGSLKFIHPPTLTADERAEKDARDRREAEARAAQADAVRRDRNLMARYPTEEMHYRAREAALDPVRLAMRRSEQRLKDLAAERKPLLDETEFYVGKPLPAKLKQQLDANEAATEAQKSAIANQEAEVGRINKFYDAELDRLRRLWGGAQPGTLPPLPAAVAAKPSSAAR